MFLFEFILRAWSEGFDLNYLRSPVALVDFAAVLPSLELFIGGGGGAAAAAPPRPGPSRTGTSSSRTCCSGR